MRSSTRWTGASGMLSRLRIRQSKRTINAHDKHEGKHEGMDKVRVVESAGKECVISLTSSSVSLYMVFSGA